jgi:hypothetical protein
VRPNLEGKVRHARAIEDRAQGLERNYLRFLVGQPRFVFVALDVIVIGTVIAIVHVHANDTVGVIASP